MKRIDFEAHFVTSDYIRAMEERIYCLNARQIGIMSAVAKCGGEVIAPG